MSEMLSDWWKAHRLEFLIDGGAIGLLLAVALVALLLGYFRRKP